jgi:HEPN domain-containing protein
MSKQTAVNWLVEQMKKPYSDKYIMDILDQALAMEKEQIEQAYWDGWQNIPSMSPQQYYTETFTEQPQK